MSKQGNEVYRAEVSGLATGWALRRRVVAGIVAVTAGVSLVFTWGASAHNIDLAKAREVVRDYARQVRDESRGKYAHFSTNCVRSYPGHNHYVRCLVEYQSESDMKKGVYTCRETIDLFMTAHSGGISGVGSWAIYAKHAAGSNKCGNRELNGVNDRSY